MCLYLLILLSTRKPVMTSPHFIAQYFTSFCEDPILLSLEQEVEEEGEEKEGYSAARQALKMEQYEQVGAVGKT